MRTKTEIKEKLEEAENARDEAEVIEQERLEQVITTLHWVLDHKIMTGPVDPVKGE